MRTIFVLLIALSAQPQAYAASSLFETAKRDPLALLPSMQELLKAEEEAASEQLPQDVQNTEISACNYTDEVLNRYRPHLYMIGLQEVARHDMHLAQDFAKAGYPEKIWRPALAGFTKANIRILKREFRHGGLHYYDIKLLMRPHEKALVRKLETYRKTSSRHLPQFSSSEFCGGDYIGFFKIRTSPAGGNLRIIREYFFQLCAAANIDPYSANCDMWMTPSVRAEFPQGTYRYRAKWPGGPEECGKSDFVSDDQIISLSVEKTNQACQR